MESLEGLSIFSVEKEAFSWYLLVRIILCVILCSLHYLVSMSLMTFPIKAALQAPPLHCLLYLGEVKAVIRVHAVKGYEGVEVLLHLF